TQGKALLAGEHERAVTDEQDVAAVLEDPARQPDGALDAIDGPHRARLERVALHDGCVALDRALLRESGAMAGVETPVVLHGLDRGLDGEERRPPAAEDRPAAA